MRKRRKRVPAITTRLSDTAWEVVQQISGKTGWSANKVLDRLALVGGSALDDKPLAVQAFREDLAAATNLHAVETKRLDEIREARRRADAARLKAFRQEHPIVSMAIGRKTRPAAKAAAKPAAKPDTK